MYSILVSATGEVRDADGTLLSAEPVEATWTVTEAELAALMQGEAS
jgi:hypothetical protein